MKTTFKDMFKGVEASNAPKYSTYKDAFRSGRNPLTSQKIEFQDLLATSQASVWLPRVISEVAREAVEPNLVLAKLLDRVDFQPGIHVIFGATGAMQAHDIKEGMEYPEEQLQIGGSSVIATVGKSGIAFKITKEMQDRSQFDLMQLHIRAAGRALARLKEQKVADHISSLGALIFDNLEPTKSLLGVTHGRDESGAANGSITWDDLFDMFGAVINNGFMPNLMILHPLTWIMFMKDPVLRTFAMAAGGGTFWGTHTGNPAGRAPWGTPAAGPTTGQSVTPANVQGAPVTGLGGMPQVGTLNSAPELPGYFLPFPLRIIVTPFAYYDPSDKTTDLIICDSSELGALVVEEDLFIDEWEDKARDIIKVKLRERYSIYIYQEGLAIAVARNVKVEPNAIVLPARTTIDYGTLPAIPATTPVV